MRKVKIACIVSITLLSCNEYETELRQSTQPIIYGNEVDVHNALNILDEANSSQSAGLLKLYQYSRSIGRTKNNQIGLNGQTVGSGTMAGQNIFLTARHNLNQDQIIAQSNCLNQPSTLNPFNNRYIPISEEVSVNFNDTNMDRRLGQISDSLYKRSLNLRLKKIGLSECIDNYTNCGGVDIRRWEPGETKTVRDYYLGECVELKTGACSPTPLCDMDNCRCGMDANGTPDGTAENKDLALMYLDNKILTDTHTNTNLYFVSPGLLYDWAEVDTNLSVQNNENTYAIFVNRHPIQNPTTGANNQLLVSDNAQIEVPASGNTKTCAGNLSSFSTQKLHFQPGQFCYDTNIEVRGGASGGPVFVERTGGFKVWGLVQGAPKNTTSDQWSPFNETGYQTNINVLSQATQKDIDNFNPNSNGNGGSDPNGKPWKAPETNYTPNTTPSNNAGNLPPGESKKHIACSSTNKSKAYAVGIFGGTNFAGKSIGTFGVVCQPWGQEPYSTQWNNTSSIRYNKPGPLSIDGGQITTPFFKAFQEGFDFRDGSLREIQAQLCPPGYGLNEVEFDYDNDNEWFVRATDIHCIATTPLNEGAISISLNDDVYENDAQGNDLRQWIGSEIQNPSYITKNLSCPSGEVITDFWIDSTNNHTSWLGVSCEPATSLQIP